MRKSRLTYIAAVALLAAACGGKLSDGVADATDRIGRDGGEVPVVSSGAPAPTTPIVMFDGSTATLGDYAGKPLVVNFWASWCPSCVAEMSAAFRPAQERLGDEVAFLGMNLQDERDRALELVDETGVLFDLAEDPLGELYVELGGIGMPFTLVIDAQGNIVEEHNGPLTEQQLIELIDTALRT